MTKQITKALSAAVVAIVAFGVFTMPAAALTTAELTALLSGLGLSSSQVSVIAALLSDDSSSGSSTNVSSGYTHTVTLSQGSSGSQVVSLQNALNFCWSTGLVADGAFGPATKAAVMTAQAEKGLVVDGVVGPNTGAAFATCMVAGTPGSDDNDDAMDDDDDNMLSGGAGAITIDALSKYSAEEVGEDEEDVPVLAFDVEADANSDVMVTAIKVEFYQNTGADSQDLDDYASEISIWYEGDEVAREDADDFSENSDIWSKTISLDEDAIIEADEEGEFVIAVSALNNLDSGDIDTDDWHVGVSSVRFVDGDGAILTEAVTLDIDDDTVDDTLEQAFDFASFGTANDAELKIGLDDDDINDARVLDADDTNDSDHEILSFYLDADGDSDIWIDEIPVVITTTGETDEAVIVVNATLYIDGEQVGGTEDVPTGGAVTFDDLDYWLDAGDRVEAILEVEMQDIDGVLDDGDTVQATVTTASIDAEDEAGDAVTATGAAAADAHTLYEAGIMVEFVGSSYIKTSSDTSGINETVEFTLEFDITAFDDDVWVEDTCVTEDTGTDVDAIEVYLEGDADFGSTTCTDVNSTGDQGTNWEVQDGQTERFTVTILGDGGEAGGAGTSVTFRARIAGIGYNLATDGAGDTVYNFSLEDFKSSAVTVFDR